MPHCQIYNNITETIGKTPLVRLSKLGKKYNIKADVLLKLEFFNPGASVKDRLALSLIEQGEKDGLIKPDTLVVEATSGNTGVGLAMVCAQKGYKLAITMPESASIERRKMMALLGAELILTDKDDGIRGAIEKADEICAKNPNSFQTRQFENKANPEVHRKTTAKEIWTDTDGQIDYFITGAGTGGTITGVGETLKKKNPAIRVIAVDPEKSGSLLGKEEPEAHKIQGIGAPFIPDILNTDIIDDVMSVTEEDAFSMAREIAVTEGIPVGISSGAMVHCALLLAQQDKMAGKTIVTIAPSYAERYLSTPLFEDLGV
jgi:cysteine synthase A